jgi:hypothetical protein
MNTHWVFFLSHQNQRPLWGILITFHLSSSYSHFKPLCDFWEENWNFTPSESSHVPFANKTKIIYSVENHPSSTSANSGSIWSTSGLWETVWEITYRMFLTRLYKVLCFIWARRDRMVVGFTITSAISTYHHWSCELNPVYDEVYSIPHYVIKFVKSYIVLRTIQVALLPILVPFGPLVVCERRFEMRVGGWQMKSD